MITYAKLNGNGEVLDTNGLRNGVTAGDTGKVDVARLDDTLLTLGGLENLLGETRTVSIL